jgi:hypothetical protein
MKRIDVQTGDRYGYLTVIQEVESRRKPSSQVVRQFKLKCDCGNEIVTVLGYLRSKITNSCGCYNKQRTSDVSRKHGETTVNGKRKFTPTYQSWRCMRERCLYPKNPRWKHYGGRGITICDRWLNLKDGYINFLNDMGPRPKGTSIDRIDVNGNYEPDNCRWATDIQQMKNRRK